MSLAGSKKWHIVRYPQKPGTQLVMGSVLKSPREPDSSLFRERDVIPIPEDDKQDQSDALRTAIQSRQSKDRNDTASGLMRLSALFSAGASAGVATDRDNETFVKAASVRATSFDPNDDYTTKVLAKPEVLDYVRKGWFSKPLYIIVGVAIGNKVDLHEAESRDHNRGLSLHASAPEAGVNAEISTSHADRSMISSSVSMETDVAFAYCVKRFRYSKIRKDLNDKGYYTTGVLMGGENQYQVDRGDDYVAKFECFIDEDSEGEDGSITIPYTA